MAYTNENIIVGAADVFLGTASAQRPTLEPNKSAAATYGKTGTPPTGWRHVGLTQGGVELSYAPDFGEVDVDQYLDVAKMYKQRQTVTVNTTFAEATLENLLFTWGQPAETLVTGAENKELTISGGSLGDRPEERKFAFVGPGPSTSAVRKERVYNLDRVLSVEQSTFALSKTEATVVPVSLRCLPASDDTSGEVTYGSILERVIT